MGRWQIMKVLTRHTRQTTRNPEDYSKSARKRESGRRSRLREAHPWMVYLINTYEARAIRQRAGMTLQDLALIVGVNPSQPSRWEVGTVMPLDHVAELYEQWMLMRLDGELDESDGFDEEDEGEELVNLDDPDDPSDVGSSQGTREVTTSEDGTGSTSTLSISTTSEETQETETEEEVRHG